MMQQKDTRHKICQVFRALLMGWRLPWCGDKVTIVENDKEK